MKKLLCIVAVLATLLMIPFDNVDAQVLPQIDDSVFEEAKEPIMWRQVKKWTGKEFVDEYILEPNGEALTNQYIVRAYAALQAHLEGNKMSDIEPLYSHDSSNVVKKETVTREVKDLQNIAESIYYNEAGYYGYISLKWVTPTANDTYMAIYEGIVFRKGPGAQ